MLDVKEFQRWYDTAKHTLRSAMRDMEGRDYNWACFKAHQAAEFALKGLLRGIGSPKYGHSVYQLLEGISGEGIDVPERLILMGKTLDQFYIPTRYVNAWAQGMPYQYYSLEDAKRAIKYSSEILSWVREKWLELLRKGNY